MHELTLQRIHYDLNKTYVIVDHEGGCFMLTRVVRERKAWEEERKDLHLKGDKILSYIWVGATGGSYLGCNGYGFLTIEEAICAFTTIELNWFNLSNTDINKTVTVLVFDSQMEYYSWLVNRTKGNGNEQTR